MNIIDIVTFLGAQYTGPSLEISGVNTLDKATSSQISFLANPKYLDLLQSTQAAAVLVTENHASLVKNPIISINPYHDFAKLLHFFYQQEGTFYGVSSLASIAPTASIGKNVIIYPFVYIADHVIIEDNVTIFPHCYIGEHSCIGAHSILYPNVTLMSRTIIKEHCILSPGAVIGSDGFGFIPTDDGIQSIPQIGNVIIESNVYIGSNTTIDRATITTTTIGTGTKIDNLVQIAHNVSIGEYCLIISQTGISGSTKIGNRVILAGQAGIAGHLHIGDGAIVGPKTGIAKDIPPGETRAGMPATNQMTFLRLSHIFPKLPDIIRNIAKLEKKITQLEQELDRRT